MADAASRTYGPWRCLEELGAGGNGTVWLAAGADGRQVALKVLKTKKPDAEPYRRFAREVSFLQSLGDYDGVLPVLDAYLPRDGVRQRPWLAMPRATPIADALDDQPLETVVAAIHAIAGTLARLSAEHGVGHRDIKPGNLYELDRAWLIGDFGLVDVPNLDEMTRSDQPLGPAHFTAYEVILDPRNAPSGPADVYSLGKTLWVLATKVPWPPDGYQSAETPGFLVSDFRAHPKGRELDRLIDRMTRLEADARPSMAQVAEDLAAWQRITLEPVDMEISDLSARYRSKQAAAFAQRDQRHERERLGQEAVSSLDQQTHALRTQLLELDPEADLNASDELMKNLVGNVHGPRRQQNVLLRYVRSCVIAAGAVHRPYGLRMGCGAHLFDDGTFAIKWSLVVGPIRSSGSDFHEDGARLEAPVGSVQQDEMIERFVGNLQARLMAAIEVFVDKAPSSQ